MARYHVAHETRYAYGAPVSLSQQQLHLSPRILPWQHCEAHHIDIDPPPNWRRYGRDAFDNPVLWVSFETPHEALTVHSTLTVEVMPHRPTFAPEETLPWETVRDRLAYGATPPDEDDLVATRFLFESPFVRIKHEFAAYAGECFPEGQPLLAGAMALMEKIHREFEFDPEATTVATPVLEVLQRKRGVCQDFAHLMIACLRSLGLAARYASGYLLTHPPPGRPRLVGADASHAWVSLYCPGGGDGWVDLDPTNNLLPDTEHITIAMGRDFSDISPLRGVILGGGSHEPEVAVTVTPLDPEEVEAAPDVP
ncbi:MAG: transglutaminase family protein [Azonexus sp.]|nr:transglutaminase family protein [Betaproteobacteria bacterium]MBK8917217.1 transglutaminase family protein [Betaproteobacteria bacterium]MBP6035613.1 transglutaminase family protein [Azonexus sp.]MBP6906153.1 transglutaminase family protein [Azonexus sp.]